MLPGNPAACCGELHSARLVGIALGSFLCGDESARGHRDNGRDVRGDILRLKIRVLYCGMIDRDLHA